MGITASPMNNINSIYEIGLWRCKIYQYQPALCKALVGGRRQIFIFEPGIRFDISSAACFVFAVRACRATS